MKLSLLFYMAVLISGVSCDTSKKSPDAITANELLISNTLDSYMDSCWNAGRIKDLKRLSTEDFIRNLNGIAVVTSQSEMQAHMMVYFTGFPDLEVKLDCTYIKDRTIFTHWTATGTHTGVFGDIAATGKKVEISGLSQLYFNTEGKLRQEDVVFNELELLQQLGFTLTPPMLE